MRLASGPAGARAVDPAHARCACGREHEDAAGNGLPATRRHKTVDINASGKVEPNGRYVKVTLKHGAFVINAVALNAKLANLNPPIDKATCSAEVSGSGSVTLLDGTGLYKGPSGKLTVAATFAVIAPRPTSGIHKGECNLSNSAQPLDQYSEITGSGSVRFS